MIPLCILGLHTDPPSLCGDGQVLCIFRIITEGFSSIETMSVTGIFDAMRFPECVIRRPSACTGGPHREDNFIGGFPYLTLKSETDEGVAKDRIQRINDSMK